MYSRLPLSRTRAISNIALISNKTLGPSSINSSRITTRYLELPAISNFLPGPLRVRDSGSRLYICFFSLLSIKNQHTPPFRKCPNISSDKIIRRTLVTKILSDDENKGRRKIKADENLVRHCLIR